MIGNIRKLLTGSSRRYAPHEDEKGACSPGEDERGSVLLMIVATLSP